MDTLCTERLMSFEDYLNYTSQVEERYELHDGVLITMSPPTLKHILIAEFIQELFKIEVKRQSLPLYCLREVGVRTGYRKVRLLDVAVFEKQPLQALLNQSAIFDIAPLLAVEVVSQESVQRDYRYKRSEYAAMAIPEYWIVDPLQNSISILNWIEGFYEVQSYTGEQKLVSILFPQLMMTPAQLFELRSE